MAYVDLNPIRAAMATTPEQSDHTSIQMRIDYWKDKTTGKQESDSTDDDFKKPTSLMLFVGKPRQPMPPGLAFNAVDYLQLVDWTGSPEWILATVLFEEIQVMGYSGWLTTVRSYARTMKPVGKINHHPACYN